MAGAEPVPGATVAASVVSTIPATMATKKAYACSTPRIKGLPRSAGRGRVGVIVTMPRLRHRRLLISSKSYFSPVRVHVVGWSALLIEVDDVEGWRVELDRRRAAHHVRRGGPRTRRRTLGRVPRGGGPPPHRHRVPGGVLRVRAGVRVPHRTAGGAGGAPAGHAPGAGTGGQRRAGRPVLRRLPEPVAGRVAADRAHLGPALRRRRGPAGVAGARDEGTVRPCLRCSGPAR